jgi:hypothetical protein
VLGWGRAQSRAATEHANMIEISKEDATAIADLLFLLSYYIRKDSEGSKIIANHAEVLAIDLRVAKEVEK